MLQLFKALSNLLSVKLSKMPPTNNSQRTSFNINFPKDLSLFLMRWRNFKHVILLLIAEEQI